MTNRKDKDNPGDGWEAVNQGNPCPKCDKSDNCTVSQDGKRCYCGRVESTLKQNDGGQWLHKLDASERRRWQRGQQQRPKKSQSAKTDWQVVARKYASRAKAQRQELAKQLGVSVESLHRLQVGWDKSKSAWTFPERNASGDIIGICCRLKNGDKWSMPGGKRGLTFEVPRQESSSPILIVEGGTDTAAGITLGLDTVGRPSASGGVSHLAELLADFTTDRQIIVLGENDKKNGDWPGREGAVSTAEKLAKLLNRLVDWALPPDGAKDLRVWLSEYGRDGDGFLKKLEIETIEPPEPKSASENHASQLVEMVVESGAELFHSPDAEPFVTLTVGNHKETHRLRGDAFQQWLGKLSWEQTKRAISSQVLDQVTGTLGGLAKYEGEEIPTFVRIASWDGDIWVDLVDSEWRSIKVGSGGWEVVANSPVRFTRSNGMHPLPVPVHGGRLADLRDFLNVGTDEDWILLQAWLVGCFRPTGPYPLLALHGEQGSAKSTTSRILRSLIDPNKSPVRSLPSEIRDLMITATNGWLIGFDNLSLIRDWMSDSLCRLSTGGGFAVRELYSNDGEKIFDVQRPVLLNGITELAKRSDLLDRTIAVTLPTISETRRKTESELWRDFNAARPGILGAILTAVSTALRNESDVRLSRQPRMADFAHWSVAAEPDLDCSTGDFMAAYANNRTQASETAIFSSVIGEPLLALLELKDGFQGSATELLKKLNIFEVKIGGSRSPKGWPQRANSLSAQLRRLVPNLRAVGWEAVLDRRDPKTRTKIISIQRVSPKNGRKTKKAKRRKPKK